MVDPHAHGGRIPNVDPTSMVDPMPMVDLIPVVDLILMGSYPKYGELTASFLLDILQ